MLDWMSGEATVHSKKRKRFKGGEGCEPVRDRERKTRGTKTKINARREFKGLEENDHVFWKRRVAMLVAPGTHGFIAKYPSILSNLKLSEVSNQNDYTLINHLNLVGKKTVEIFIRNGKRIYAT